MFRTPLVEPTALCSLQAESVIVGYYAFRRKRIPVRLYACTDNFNPLRFFTGLRHFSVAFAATVSRFATPLPGIAGCTETVHPSEGPRETRGPGDDSDGALTPLISSSPLTESATVATIATVVLPLPILPLQPSR